MNVYRRIAGALTVALIVLALAATFGPIPWWPALVVAVVAGLWWGFGLMFFPDARAERAGRAERRQRRADERAGREG